MNYLCPQCDSARIAVKHTGKRTGSAIATVAGTVVSSYRPKTCALALAT